MMSVLLILWGCATHTITGTVQSIDQTPLANASCSMFDQTSESDDAGTFAFEGLSVKKGEYPIQCTHQGFEFYQQDIMLQGSTVTLPPIMLTPLDIQIPYLEINMDPESDLIPVK